MVICDWNGNKIIFQGRIFNSLLFWFINKFIINGHNNTISVCRGGEMSITVHF